MERIPIELIYVLAFIGFILYNVFTQIAARRRQQEEPPVAEPEAPGGEAPLEDEPLEEIWGRLPARAAPVPAAPVTAAAEAREPAARNGVHPVRALLRGPRDLRRAMVLSMVLGPCRAQEPPEDPRRSLR